jgi:hypothetical protein
MGVVKAQMGAGSLTVHAEEMIAVVVDFVKTRTVLNCRLRELVRPD